jgi:hypothetical protein
MKKTFAAALAAAALILGVQGARAQDTPTPLIIGNVQLIMIRNGDTVNGRAMSIGERIGHVQDIFAKHLGGKYAKITSKKWGDRTHLYLNGDFVLGVSLADAKSTGYKTTEALSVVWLAALKKGFDATHVGPGVAKP